MKRNAVIEKYIEDFENNNGGMHVQPLPVFGLDSVRVEFDKTKLSAVTIPLNLKSLHHRGIQLNTFPSYKLLAFSCSPIIRRCSRRSRPLVTNGSP
jgi:hypothetical protein